MANPTDHYKLNGLDVHGTIWQTVADTTARLALSLAEEDLGKDVLQSDTDHVYKLIVDTGVNVAGSWVNLSAAAAGGVNNWIDLIDTDPTSFAGEAGQFVRVNATPDGLEFVDPPSGATWLEDAYTPTLGQVTFILSQAPTEPDSLSLHANGIEAVETDDYTLSGTTLTWLNTEFSFETDDGVVIQYK
jgi:hypothetical protein